MTKQCLNCGHDFECKRETGKFCSDRCRAAYNRANPKGVITKKQARSIYNEILDLIERVKSEPQQPYFGVVTKDEVKWGQTQDPVKIKLKRPFLTLQALVNECESQEEYEPIRREIEEADHLTDREKAILLRKR